MDARCGLGLGLMASGDFRYRRTVFRAMPSTPAIRRMERPAPFISYISFTSPTFSNSSEVPPAVSPDDATILGWVNSTSSISLIFTSALTTEAAPLLAREQSLFVEGLAAIGDRLPFAMRGIDSDKDSVFINETPIKYFASRGIHLTRSRAYRKNNQAWIEQKNGSVVRRFVGHDRYSGPVAGQTMAHLYGAMDLYVNYFQTSFKLIEKTRDGATTVKHYSLPTTPCDRLMQHD